MRFYLSLLCCLILTSLVNAQTGETPYEIALARIERAASTPQIIGLNLSRLGLTEIPPEIGSLSRLRWLTLDHNQLISLPSEIGKLHDLRILDLSNNQLTGLPAEFSQLSNLCHLDLNNNRLQHLPTALWQLDQLSSAPCNNYFDFDSLRIYGNPLISPPEEVLAQGTPAILAYLRNEAWWHLQRLIISAASALGLVVMLILGLRWRNRRGKSKKKRATTHPLSERS